MKRIIAIAAVLLSGIALVLFATGSGDDGGYRVRAIFDNAGFVIPGMDVKIAGVVVGDVQSLDVTQNKKAAVVLNIDNPDYQDFRTDATCTIRPQALIGEKFVECSPSKPRAPGTPPPPLLPKIKQGPGKGEYLLPATNTTKTIDLDLINNVMRLPYRQRLTIILNEFGTALAGNGQDLNVAIKKANPALKALDDVLKVLAEQNKTLASLAKNGDEVLAPLARQRARVTGFINSSGETAQATAEESAALQENLQKFPAFLRELGPTMDALGGFADAFTPVVQDLGGAATDINAFVAGTPAFASAGVPALRVARRHGRRRRSGAAGLAPARPGPRDAGQDGQAALEGPQRAAHLAEEHRRHQPADGLLLLRHRRGQRIRPVRPLPARAPRPHAVPDLRHGQPAPVHGELQQGPRRRLRSAGRVVVRRARERRACEQRPVRRRDLGDPPAQGAPARRRRHPPGRRRGTGARHEADRQERARPALGPVPPRLPPGRMRKRTGAASIAANPVLIGAATTLVVIVAVFLAYNANSGLPFVPTYDIKVEVPSAAGLVRGNDVRVGGTRVGTVADINPVTRPNGVVTAQLGLKLETVVEPLPADTRVLIRPRSALGLKYVQLTRGTSSQDLPNGGTLPLRQAVPQPVELDEFFNMFDDETRRAAQANLTEFGNTLAGRGTDLNFAIQELNPLLDQLTPVMKQPLERADRPQGLHRRPGPERRGRRPGRPRRRRTCS